MSLYERIYGDESRLMQVIINFLSNSLKFSSDDSKIVVYLKMIEDHMTQVSHTGPKDRNSEQVAPNSEEMELVAL